MSFLSFPLGFRRFNSLFEFVDTISSNTRDYDLYNELVNAGWDEVQAVDAEVNIDSGVIVGSSGTGSPAFSVDALPEGSVVAVNNSGRIEGAAGDGGSSDGTFNGTDGGTALRVRHAVDLSNNETWSGGGGGGAAEVIVEDGSGPCTSGAGGGGAGGDVFGSGGTSSGHGSDDPGSDGTTEAGGAGGSSSCVTPGSTTSGSAVGGDGGDPGVGGQNGSVSSSGDGGIVSSTTGTGGNAGAAVDGDSFVTYVTTGDIRGSQIN